MTRWLSFRFSSGSPAHLIRGTAWRFVAVALLVGCGGEHEPAAEEAPPESTQEVAAAPPEAEVAERAARSVPLRIAAHPERFAHGAHRGVDCLACHTRPQGHGTHASVSCSQCHEGGANTGREPLSRDECLSCHHGAEQSRSCQSCHGEPHTRTAERTLQLTTWAAPRVRELPFDHDLHGARECSTCHRTRPSLRPDRDCASCHDEHHRPDATCMACHQPTTRGTHDLDSHLTCAGAGCHADPAVDEMEQSRSYCLVCHQEQVDHEPGSECAPCHQVRPNTLLPPAAPGYAGAHAEGKAGAR